MGDEVKITVIATGFRQGSAERRDRMLSASLRQSSAPRIEARPATPRFASEDDDADFDAPAAPAARTPVPQPVLVPVSARELVSAFRPNADSAPSSELTITEMDADPQPESTRSEPEFTEPAYQDDAVAVGVSSEPQTVLTSHRGFEEDHDANLDIPAFMRQGSM